MGNVIASPDDLYQRKWATRMLRHLLRCGFDGIQLNFDYPGSQTRPVNRHSNLKRFLKVRVLSLLPLYRCVCPITTLMII